MRSSSFASPCAVRAQLNAPVDPRTISGTVSPIRWGEW